MTTFVNTTKKCEICGSDNEFREIISSNSFGNMDLDTRPPQMMRSTLPYQIEFCENCGYANADIESLISLNDKEIINSYEYKKILNNFSINETSKAFLLSGILHSKHNKYRECAFYI